MGESAALMLDVGLTDPAAPEHGYTHVYVPYCTGDLHWGNATVRYQGGVTIEHRGAVNAQTAVDWLQANLPLTLTPALTLALALTLTLTLTLTVHEQLQRLEPDPQAIGARA